MLIKKFKFSEDIIVGHRNSDFEEIDSKYNKNTFVDLSIEIHDDCYIREFSRSKSKEMSILTQPYKQFDLNSKFVVENVTVTSKKLFDVIENRGLRLHKNDYTVLVLKDTSEGRQIINEICELLNNLVFSKDNAEQKEAEKKKIEKAEKEFFELTNCNTPGDLLHLAKYTLYSSETEKDLVLLNDVFFLSNEIRFLEFNTIMSKNKDLTIRSKVVDDNVYNKDGYNLTTILPIIKKCFYKVEEISSIEFADSSVSSQTKNDLNQKKYSALNSAIHESIFGTAATIDRNQRAMSQQTSFSKNPVVLSISFKNMFNGELMFFSPKDKYIEIEKNIKQTVQKIQFKLKQTQEPEKENKVNDDVYFERVIKLKKLLDLGAITQEEFDAKKKEILSKL